MSKIFMSYRRTDSMALSGRIYDRLVQHFGYPNVFKDVDNIPPGEDFPQYIQRSLRDSAIQLVIIGPHWLDALTPEGQPRLTTPGDFVHTEIATALRLGLPIIPVLVEGAAMPSPDLLPTDLRKLALINAVRVRDDPDFSHDMQSLIAAIERILGRFGSPSSTPGFVQGGLAASMPLRDQRHNDKRIIGATVAAVLVVIALVSALVLHGSPGGSSAARGGIPGTRTSTRTASSAGTSTASPVSGTPTVSQLTPLAPTPTIGPPLPSGSFTPNWQLSCGGCDAPLLVTVPKVTIDDTHQNMVWTFNFYNHSGGSCEANFDSLNLQDPSGQSYDGAGDATYSGVSRLDPGQSGQATATFAFVPDASATYVLTASLYQYECVGGTVTHTNYGPQSLTFPG